jgi:hypothetical protein
MNGGCLYNAGHWVNKSIGHKGIMEEKTLNIQCSTLNAQVKKAGIIFIKLVIGLIGR